MALWGHDDQGPDARPPHLIFPRGTKKIDFLTGVTGTPKVGSRWHMARGTRQRLARGTRAACQRWHEPVSGRPRRAGGTRRAFQRWHVPGVPDPAVPVARGTAGAGVWHEVAHGTAHNATNMITTITTAAVAIVKRHQNVVIHSVPTQIRRTT